MKEQVTPKPEENASLQPPTRKSVLEQQTHHMFDRIARYLQNEVLGNHSCF